MVEEMHKLLVDITGELTNAIAGKVDGPQAAEFS
jgi:hypothetical protein